MIWVWSSVKRQTKIANVTKVGFETKQSSKNVTYLQQQWQLRCQIFKTQVLQLPLISILKMEHLWSHHFISFLDKTVVAFCFKWKFLLRCKIGATNLFVFAICFLMGSSIQVKNCTRDIYSFFAKNKLSLEKHFSILFFKLFCFKIEAFYLFPQFFYFLIFQKNHLFTVFERSGHRPRNEKINK